LARPTTNSVDLFTLLPSPAVISTRTEGHIAAEQSKAERYRQITDLLTERGPLANWQIADALRCQPHQTSGRLTELRAENVIENTGERRRNPRTNVSGEVVRLKSTGLDSDNM